jgi:methylmalonyl-CoA/ethylmalonyl-CoA epimerase
MTVKPPSQIEHIGIAVKNLEQSVMFYTELLGLQLLGYDEVESEQVRVAFLTIGETRLELLEATSEDSPIAQFIAKKGEGIHHIAVKVDNIEERLSFLADNDIRLIHQSPKEGAHGSLVAFLHPKSTQGVLLELCQPTAEGEKHD